MGATPQASRAADGLADPDAVAGELARLAVLDLGALRVAYRNRTGRIAPARVPRALLLRVLSYRVQADAHGDIGPDARRMLDRLARATTHGAGGDATARAGAHSAPALTVPRRGAVLVREWRGRQERVTVVEGGFAWNGARYPSLSAAAQAITGTKWNGRRFFGLDRPADKPAQARDGRPGHRRAESAPAGAAP